MSFQVCVDKNQPIILYVKQMLVLGVDPNHLLFWQKVAVQENGNCR